MKAGGVHRRDDSLAEKLAAARRNGVLVFEDRFGSRYWFQETRHEPLCVWYSSRRRSDSGHAGPLQFLARLLLESVPLNRHEFLRNGF